MQYLKQSTAVVIKLGPFLDETDGHTAEGVLAITQADIRLTKNGGNFAQVNHAQGGGNLAYDEFGWYDCDLDTTDTNTLGRLIVAVHESGALPVWREFMVIPANEYDSLVSGSDALDVEVASMAAGTVTAAAIAADAIGAAEIADGAIDAATFAAGAIDAAAIAANAIGASEIADGAIDAGAIAADAITAAKIADGAIDAATFAAGAINAAAVADGAIDAATFAAGAIDAAAIAANAIGASEIADGAIDAGAIAADAITAAKIADGAIDAATFAAGAINAAAVADGAIDAATFAAGAIDAAAIAANAIGASEIADGAIDAGAIAADAITAAKIADGAIDAATFAAGAINAAAIAADAIGASELAADAVAEIADGVWDEVLTSATHNIGYSAGQRLRYLILTGATAQAGAANSITLAATESATDNIFNECIISVVSGTGAGQTRLVAEYDGGTKVAIVDKAWFVTPDATSVYEILPFTSILLAHHGVATAGAATTITLAATASATNDTYIGSVIYISTGTGVGQARVITDYDGGTKVATVSDAWTTNPAAGSVYKVLPVGRVIVDTLAADAMTAIADALLCRDMSAPTGEAARSPLNALRALRNKVTVSGGTMTVLEEDDSTTAWTADVTTDAAAALITEIDPT